MTVWEYIINSGAWSLGGLAVGYFLGRMERDIREVRDSVRRSDEEKHR